MLMRRMPERAGLSMCSLVRNVEATLYDIGDDEDMAGARDAAQEIEFNKININCRALHMANRRREASSSRRSRLARVR